MRFVIEEEAVVGRFMKRPLLFVAGQPFAHPGNGLQQRTKLMAKLLGRSDAPVKRLIVPCNSDEERLLYEEMGWDVFVAPVETTRMRQRARLLDAAWAKLFRDRNSELLRIFGCSPQIPKQLIHRVRQDIRNPLVWIYRSDYWNLVRYRRPGESWVIDTNDSIYRLLSVYPDVTVTRRLLWPNQARLADLLFAHERRWPSRYDVVIAICREDAQLFGSQMGPCHVVRFDTCIDLPAGYSMRQERDIDIGFLGAAHPGSVDAARRLIAMAEQGLFGGKELVIAGLCTSFLPKAGMHFRCIGPVEKSMFFWQRCQTVIFPLTQPTGISVKFQEAVAAGCYVVCKKGGYEWSKATPCLDYREFADESEIPSMLRACPASARGALKGLDQTQLGGELSTLLRACEDNERWRACATDRRTVTCDS